MKGQKLLKVTSILMIIGGVIAVIAGILATVICTVLFHGMKTPALP